LVLYIFFKIYGKLSTELKHNIDLIDLGDNSRLSKHISNKKEFIRVA